MSANPFELETDDDGIGPLGRCALGLSFAFGLVVLGSLAGAGGCTQPVDTQDPDFVWGNGFPTETPNHDQPSDPDKPVGEIQERFATDATIGRVTDRSTGKVWLKNSTAAPLAWQEAVDLCASLEMRLPTVGELATIIGDHDGCALDPAFSGPCEAHWTTEKTKVVSAFAYALDVSVPEVIDSHVNSDHHARCVADSPDGPEAIGNASVNLAGKLWVAASPPITLFQEGAVAACDDLCFDGSCDWRLPTRDELVALTLMPGADCAMPNALGGSCGAYWSSTPTEHSHLYAFQVDYATAAVDSYELDAWAHYRCVRTP